MNEPHSQSTPLHLDISLEKARALHRVWRALNDNDCPKCNTLQIYPEVKKTLYYLECQTCGFTITISEIEQIERMFAPAMKAALEIFLDWRRENNDESPL